MSHSEMAVYAGTRDDWERDDEDFSRNAYMEAKDQLERDAKFSTWDFLDSLQTEDLRGIVAEVIHALWRSELPDDFHRIAHIRNAVEEYIDAFAGEELEHY